MRTCGEVCKELFAAEDVMNVHDFSLSFNTHSWYFIVCSDNGLTLE